MVTVIRSLLFQIAYWITSFIFVLGALPFAILPGRRPLMIWIRTYTRIMCVWMRVIAGVKLRVTGKERLPDGPFIIAAKHQSWGDGFLMFSQFDDLAFVTGDHLERFPFVGGILRKMGALIVDNCGGAHARARLVDEELLAARAENRRVLIYPEGHLAPAGKRYRYKKGVYHMYKNYDCPVVPAATNLGQFWPQQSWRLRPGVAVLDFLEPIAPGAEKDAFMANLEDSIERRSIALLGDERPAGLTIGELIPDPKGNHA